MSRFELLLYQISTENSEEPLPQSNVFAYQRYGKATDMALELPFVVDNPVDFHLIAPDGRDFGTDLMARAQYMQTMV